MARAWPDVWGMTRLLPVTIATLALVGGSVASIPAAAMVPGAESGVQRCASDGASSARAMRGHQASDPNDVTVREAARAGRDLRAQMLVDGLSRRSVASLAQTSASSPAFRIDVRVHIITRDDGTGGVPRAMLNDQIRVLNESYTGQSAAGSARTPFRFRIKTIDVTRNSDWYDWSIYTDTDDEEAKAALHKGGWDDLNLYITGLSDYLLGYATFPFEDETLQSDGVVLLNDSLPGGSAAPYNEGDTAPHEVGHWLGLYHTFENGCTEPGDSVADTAYQLDGDNIFYCNETDDTCTAPGLDPVHNFMSYGDDPCLDNFTRGQAIRQIAVWLAYRA